MVSYTKPLGTDRRFPGTVAEANPINGYSVHITNKNPENAVITAGMFKVDQDDGDNGGILYALYAANDIAARSLEVTQGVQNLYNDMPLVAGRRAYVRLYASADYPVSNINAQLRGYKNGKELTGSPLQAESRIPVRNSGIDRTKLHHAFLFKLPSDWRVSGDLNLVATVDPEGLYKDKKSSNNYYSTTVNFKLAEDSVNEVVDVPLEIHEDADTDKPVIIYESNSPTYASIANHMLRMHPIADQIHNDCGIKPLKPIIGHWNVAHGVDWARMLSRVMLRRALNSCRADNAYWHGMVHPDFRGDTDTVGMALPYTRSAVVMMEGHREGAARWSMPGGSTFAHEMGHAKTLNHVCSHNDPAFKDNNYPYPDECLMSTGEPQYFTNGHDGYFIMDVYHDYWGLSEPVILGSNDSTVKFLEENKAYPLMAYYGTHEWISPYSYCKLLNKEGIACDKDLISARYSDDVKKRIAQSLENENLHSMQASRNSNGSGQPAYIPAYPISTAVLPSDYHPLRINNIKSNLLMVSGHFDLSKPVLETFELRRYRELPSDILLQEVNKFQDGLLNRNTKSYSNVLVLNQYNNITSRKLLRADIVSDLAPQEEDPSPHRFFISMVRLQSDASYYELAYGTHVVATSNASTHKPIIMVEKFNDIDLKADTVIRWTAEDQDNDPLTFSIYYRTGGGWPWTLIDMDITGNSYAMRDNLPGNNTNPLRYYAGSNSGQFKVVAYDGFHIAEDESQEFIVPYNKPEVSIRQQDGLSIKLGQTLNLNGTASDREDGPIPSADHIKAAAMKAVSPNKKFRWTSNIDGNLGYGYELSTRSLSRGLHKITLAVTDSEKMVGEASVHVRVGMEDAIATNIAPLAIATASSSFCILEASLDHCYKPQRINDGSNNTAVGGKDSWTNNDGQPLPQWVQLTWPTKVLISGAELYSTVDYVVGDYDLQYWNGVEWASFVTVRGNTSVYNSHSLIDTIVTDRIRVLGFNGSSRQPSYIRINELIVNGNTLN